LLSVIARAAGRPAEAAVGLQFGYSTAGMSRSTGTGDNPLRSGQKENEPALTGARAGPLKFQGTIIAGGMHIRGIKNV